MNSLVMENSIFLNPGDCFWGDASQSIRTILGSCVAVTLWHPELKIGGMCHYLLASSASADSHISPRYANGAFNWLRQQVEENGNKMHEFHGKVFGGGNMFNADINRISQVGDQNINMAFDLMDKHGIPLVSHHTGGSQFRAVRFDINSGDVWVSSQSVNNHNGNTSSGSTDK